MTEQFKENSEHVSNDDQLAAVHLHSGEEFNIRLNILSPNEIKSLKEMQDHADVKGGDYLIAFFEMRAEKALHFTKIKKTDLALTRKKYLHMSSEEKECHRMKLKLV